ncbi:MAG: elongation factor P maturation arginine rhamnosyltransferase EarP, partial [Betaproteobacteria bacterium]
MSPSIRWDIFCRVVDNFGDAGVCWRLARQLAAEHGLAVTLWIDDVRTLSRIVPTLDAELDDQGVAGVRVCRLTEAAAAAAIPADVVIEGFGCGIPEGYVAAMAAATHAPGWIVLEYLSAEPWIDASHGLPSPHPRYPLTRTFWFPGFTPQSGGLLREAGLLARRDDAVIDGARRAEMLRLAGVTPMPDVTL